MCVNFSVGWQLKTKKKWCWAGFGVWFFGGGPRSLYQPHILRNHRTAQNRRTPQMSSHCTAVEYTYILRNHRTPQNHRILGNGTYFNCFYPEIRMLFCFSKNGLESRFLEYGESMEKMEFPPETLAVSDTIAFHALFAPDVFSFFGTPAGSPGPSGKLFWCVTEKMNGVAM